VDLFTVIVALSLVLIVSWTDVSIAMFSFLILAPPCTSVAKGEKIWWLFSGEHFAPLSWQESVSPLCNVDRFVRVRQNKSHIVKHP
jgi:hypothetical protein